MNDIRCVRLWRPDEETRVPRAPEDGFTDTVAEPELHIFPAAAERNLGIGAIICPGGGYAGLSIGPEGHACAEWLSSIGVTAMTLLYRLPRGNKTVPLEDMRAAMRYARENAARLGFSAGSLGVVGFSAGGHLASLACVGMPRSPEGARPDFAVLFYPVTVMDERKHASSRRLLLGDHPTDQEIAEYSSCLHVTAQTPPTLLLLCDDDSLVPPMQSVLYYEALKKNNIPGSMHIFPVGGHGWGFRGVSTEGGIFPQAGILRSILADWLSIFIPS